MNSIWRVGVSCFVASLSVARVSAFESVIPLLEGEKWWGGAGGSGERQPYGGETASSRYDLRIAGHTSSPLLVSTRGRYLWSEKPFAYRFANGALKVESDEGEEDPYED